MEKQIVFDKIISLLESINNNIASELLEHYQTNEVTFDALMQKYKTIKVIL